MGCGTMFFSEVSKSSNILEHMIWILYVEIIWGVYFFFESIGDHEHFFEKFGAMNFFRKIWGEMNFLFQIPKIHPVTNKIVIPLVKNTNPCILLFVSTRTPGRRTLFILDPNTCLSSFPSTSCLLISWNKSSNYQQKPPTTILVTWYDKNP